MAEDAVLVEDVSRKSNDSEEAVGCIVFKQRSLLIGRQLIQGLLALAQTQKRHFPPALQRQQIVIYLKSLATKEIQRQLRSSITLGR